MKILRGFIVINYIIIVFLYGMAYYYAVSPYGIYAGLDAGNFKSVFLFLVAIILMFIHYIAIYFSYEKETRKEHNTFLCCSTITFLLCIIAYIYEPKAVRPYSEANFKSLIPLLLYVMAVLFFVVQVVGAVRSFIKKRAKVTGK